MLGAATVTRFDEQPDSCNVLFPVQEGKTHAKEEPRGMLESQGEVASGSQGGD